MVQAVKTISAIFFAAFLGLLCFGQPAHSQMRGVATCPTGTPSPDGSVITPGSNCSLTDSGSNVWDFGALLCAPNNCWGQQIGSLYQTQKNGSSSGLSASYQLEAFGGQIYNRAVCDKTYYFIDPNTTGQLQIPSPANPTSLTNHVTAQSGAFNYPSLFNLYSGTLFNSNFAYTVLAQAGLPFWYDEASVGHGQTGLTNISITGQPGATIFCGSGQNGGIIEQYNVANLSVSDLSMGNNHAANSGPNSCVNQIQSQQGLNLTHIYCSNSDVCFFAGGNNGNVNWNDVWADYCGGDMSTGASTHNIYRGMHLVTDSTIWTWNGGGSTCVTWDPTKQDDVGFEVKDRSPNSSFTNDIFGEPSPNGHTGCEAAATLDYPCNGVHSITHSIIEIGPHNDPGPNGIARIRDDNGANCENVNYPSNSTTFSYDIILDDCGALGNTAQCGQLGSPGQPNGCGAGSGTHWALTNNDVPVMCQYGTPPVGTVNEVDHSIIVNPDSGCANGATSCQHALGPNVVDGGGNVFYTSRAAAGFAAFPAYPSKI